MRNICFLNTVFFLFLKELSLEMSISVETLRIRSHLYQKSPISSLCVLGLTNVQLIFECNTIFKSPVRRMTEKWHRTPFNVVLYFVLLKFVYPCPWNGQAIGFKWIYDAKQKHKAIKNIVSKLHTHHKRIKSDRREKEAKKEAELGRRILSIWSPMVGPTFESLIIQSVRIYCNIHRTS